MAAESSNEASADQPPVEMPIPRTDEEARRLFPGAGDEWDWRAPLGLRWPGVKLAARADLKNALEAHLAYLLNRHAAAPIPTQGPTKHSCRLLQGRDGKLLESVRPEVAEKYLAIGARQRQKLIAAATLAVVGKGHTKRITVQSLLAYEPGDSGEIPK
jgi:hypothetical protein